MNNLNPVPIVAADVNPVEMVHSANAAHEQSPAAAKDVTTVVDVRTAAVGSYVYVGRKNDRKGLPGSIWNNPFYIGKTHGSREEVIEKFRQRLMRSPDLLSQLHTLRGKVLGCWCCDWNGVGEPEQACHAVLLARLADGPFGDPPSEGNPP